jgi:hypothetical protein
MDEKDNESNLIFDDSTSKFCCTTNDVNDTIQYHIVWHAGGEKNRMKFRTFGLGGYIHIKKKKHEKSQPLNKWDSFSLSSSTKTPIQTWTVHYALIHSFTELN